MLASFTHTTQNLHRGPTTAFDPYVSGSKPPQRARADRNDGHGGADAAGYRALDGTDSPADHL
jgi:hypothetical protein